MNLPTIHGIIDRRILINFAVDADVAKRIIPQPFSPQLYLGKAIAGICLIRLKNIKPKGFPGFFGLCSENGAHRIAVEWDEDGVKKQGVYIPRRDTSLKLNALAGGRIFPGRHHLADFNVLESQGHYHIECRGSDNISISIDARETEDFNVNSVFRTLKNASDFFEQGEVGYSPNGSKYEGLKLQAYRWHVKPLEVINVRSSFFENEEMFPKGSVQFDNALLMTQIEHEWHSMKSKPVQIRLSK